MNDMKMEMVCNASVIEQAMDLVNRNRGSTSQNNQQQEIDQPNASQFY
jgi:hypothetical protein